MIKHVRVVKGNTVTFELVHEAIAYLDNDARDCFVALGSESKTVQWLITTVLLTCYSYVCFDRITLAFVHNCGQQHSFIVTTMVHFLIAVCTTLVVMMLVTVVAIEYFYAHEL